MSRRCKIEKYLIKEKCIGRGTFSAVFQVQNVKNKHKFALKKVFIGNIEDKKAKNDCINEVYLLQRLDHPNIIKYFCCEFDEEKNTLNILLELAYHGDLSRFIADHIKKSSLIDEKTIWKFVIQLSSAIEFMHSNRIMHRDLKPANVLLSESGDIRICDFGLGKYFVEGSKLYSTSAQGSPYYMSPERLLQKKYYFNSDIWSVGCIIYELAALQSPFYVSKLDIKLLIKRVIKCDYPPLPSDMYSKELHSIIDTCLTIDCEKRLQASEILNLAQNFYAKQHLPQ